MEYAVLDPETIPEYLAKLSRLTQVLGEGEGVEIEEIGDGNLNYVYRVRRRGAPERSLILKQAVPFLRVGGEGWPLGRHRMTFEIRALKAYQEIVPEYVPAIYHADEEMSVLIMEDLGRDVTVLRYPMIEGKVFPRIGSDIGLFLAKTLFKTSYLGMESLERRHMMQDFNLNDELCKLTEDFIFTFPFVDHPSNYQNRPTNEYALEKLSGDREFMQRVLHFKELFLSKSDALVHGDLHTGSLMAGNDKTYVIDMEFAFFGPFGFDVGKIIANFIMCATSHLHREGGRKYREWLFSQCKVIWETFEREFRSLWDAKPQSALLYDGLLTDDVLVDYKSRVMRSIFRDMVGFCACSLARRTVGIAGVADIRGIQDVEIRTALERINIDLSHAIMLQYEEISTMDQLLALVTERYASSEFEKLEVNNG